jgi:oligopeptide/dipeptide ABC transporter ATP-binding protein
MYAGKIVEATRTGTLFDRMRHPYTQALLAAIPRLAQPADQQLHSIPGIPPDLARPPAGCRFAPRCRHATDLCRRDEPELAGPVPGHVYACWHPVDGPLPPARPLPQAGPAEVADRVEPAPGAGALLRLDGLVKEFPLTSGLLQRAAGAVHAVSGVSFEIAAGRTFGLVGESGCGKTTIGRMIVGLETPNQGRVTLGGVAVSALRGRERRRRRRDLQMMFQDPYASLDPRMRVGAILREPLAVQGIGTRRGRQERVRELLAEVGLPEGALDRYPHEFSGGQRQRIGLARALTLNPQVIVADEPVSALDVSIRAQVLNLMKRLQRAHHLTYLVISHDLAVVKYLADRIGVMYLGKLVEVGSAGDIYQRATHPYTAGLIATIPVPEPSVERAKSDPAIAGELPSPVNPPSGCRFRTRCRYAQRRCAEEEPALRGFGPGHLAACHFPLR